MTTVPKAVYFSNRTKEAEMFHPWPVRWVTSRLTHSFFRKSVRSRLRRHELIARLVEAWVVYEAKRSAKLLSTHPLQVAKIEFGENGAKVFFSSERPLWRAHCNLEVVPEHPHIFIVAELEDGAWVQLSKRTIPHPNVENLEICAYIDFFQVNIQPRY